MSDLKPGEAKIHWRFWMECGPSETLTEIPEHGYSLYLSDIKCRNPECAIMATRLLGISFLEQFLHANGVGPVNLAPDGKSFIGFKDLKVEVDLLQKQENGEWRSIP